jgi:hypothetical protein
MIVDLFFVLVGMMDGALFNPSERSTLLQWPVIVFSVVGHAFLFGMLVVVIRRVRRKEASWFGDLAVKGLYVPWFFYFFGVWAQAWYFR